MAVLAIIAILTTIAVVVAGRVTNSGRVQATQDIIRILDTALDSYVAARGHQSRPRTRTTPTPSTRSGTAAPSAAADAAAEPSVQLFLLIATEVPEVRVDYAELDAKFVSRADQHQRQPRAQYVSGVLTNVNARS